MNEDILISYERIRFGKQTRFNPIRTLTPESLTYKLDLFEYGFVREAAQLWDSIENRDYTLMSVLPKRRSAVARRAYKIVAKDESPEAAAHKATLEYFYSNVTATNAIDRNIEGGFPQLVRQMMDSLTKRYSVHHIVWQPSTQGLTAQLFFVPLWYFENTTGALRFLLQDFDTQGQPLGPAEWMITCGLGIMQVCSICYMFKHLPLKDWLIYSDRFGSPGVQGKTQAAPGTEAWNVMLKAVSEFRQGFSCVTGLNDLIEKLDFSTTGDLPFEKLIELMDRAMATIARGADLSTMSGRGGSHGGGQGASLQGQEAELLLADDCMLIEETLQEQLDKWVIFYQHGTLTPLAYITIDKPELKDVQTDLAVDAVLFTTNFPMTVGAVAERYERPIPEGVDPDTLVITPKPAPPQPPKPGVPDPALNDAFHQKPRDLDRFLGRLLGHIDQANNTAWKPITDRLEAVMACNDAHFRPMCQALLADVPALLKTTGLDAVAIQAWQESLAASFANGAIPPKKEDA